MLDLRWPKSGPDFNLWNNDAAAFTALLQAHPGFWSFDFPLKYLRLNVDTRDGGFTLADRDGERIDPDRVIAAIARWNSFCGSPRRPAESDANSPAAGRAGKESA